MKRFFALLCAIFLVAACNVLPGDVGDINAPGAGMISLARHMQAKGDHAGAMEFYRRAVATDPKNIVALKGIADLLDQIGDHASAGQYYRNALALEPRDGELHRNYGKSLLAMDDPSSARDQYAAALDIESDDIKARNGLGIALDYLGDHVGAQKQYQMVLREDPKNLSTMNNLAYSYILIKKYDAAIALLEPEVKNPAAKKSLRQNLALAYGMSGMDLDAERVARMDLPAAKVQENMAYYKKQRAELKISTAPYAEIGTYATQALAAAQIEKLKPQLKHADVELKPIITPEVATPGGTPRFTVRMMGCTKPDQVQTFCDQLARKGLPCVARNQ